MSGHTSNTKTQRMKKRLRKMRREERRYPNRGKKTAPEQDNDAYSPEFSAQGADCAGASGYSTSASFEEDFEAEFPAQGADFAYLRGSDTIAADEELVQGAIAKGNNNDNSGGDNATSSQDGEADFSGQGADNAVASGSNISADLEELFSNMENLYDKIIGSLCALQTDLENTEFLLDLHRETIDILEKVSDEEMKFFEHLAEMDTSVADAKSFDSNSKNLDEVKFPSDDDIPSVGSFQQNPKFPDDGDFAAQKSISDESSKISTKDAGLASVSSSNTKLSTQAEEHTADTGLNRSITWAELFDDLDAIYVKLNEQISVITSDLDKTEILQNEATGKMQISDGSESKHSVSGETQQAPFQKKVLPKKRGRVSRFWRWITSCCRKQTNNRDERIDDVVDEDVQNEPGKGQNGEKGVKDEERKYVFMAYINKN